MRRLPRLVGRCALGILVLLTTVGSAVAEGWRPPSSPGSWGRFGAGFVSGIVGHELGHLAVATAQGHRVAFRGPSLTYPGANLSDSEQLHVASAGFQSQWLLAETALRYHEQRGPQHHMGQFGAGVVTAHIAITGAYLYVLKQHENGDITGVSEASGIPRDQLLAMALVPALLDGWRLLDDRVPPWVPALSLGVKGSLVTLIWTH